MTKHSVVWLNILIKILAWLGYAMDATYLSVLNRRIRDWRGQRLHLRSVYRLWFVVLVWTLVVAAITRLLLLPVVAVVVLGVHTDMLSL